MVTPERRLQDSSETIQITRGLLVRAGRIAFILQRLGDKVAMSDDVQGNDIRLRALWPPRTDPYAQMTRSLVSEDSRTFGPGDSIRIGRRHGIQIADPEGFVNEDRTRRFVGSFGPLITMAISIDTTLSRNHVRINFLHDAEVEITDLGSTNGTHICETEPVVNPLW